MASNGADIHHKDNTGGTSLMIGIYYLDEQFKFISFNGKISPYSKIAAQNGHRDVVEFLANKGADIHHKDNNGFTALMIGIYY